MRFRDRAQREMAIEPGHEGAILTAAAGVIQSYRQLPVVLYETWQQFRGEERMVGGLLGARESRVADAYSLHADAAALDEGYGRIRAALAGAYAPCGVDACEAIAAEDASGHAVAHKLVYPVAGGEETVARCRACGYAADPTGARLSKAPPPAEEPLPMQDVETPACKTIAELASFLGIPPSRTAKAVFLVANLAGEGDRFVFAVVRGDTALNEAKLKAVLNAETIGPATEAEIRQAGAEPGYGSPVGLSGVTVVADDLAAHSPNLVAGANRPGYHALNVNHGRDYQATIVADIAMAQEGSPCPVCGSPLDAGARRSPGRDVAGRRPLRPGAGRHLPGWGRPGAAAGPGPVSRLSGSAVGRHRRIAARRARHRLAGGGGALPGPPPDAG